MTDINTQVNRVALGMALEDLEKARRAVLAGDPDTKWELSDCVNAALRNLYAIHPDYRPTGSLTR